MVRWIMQYYLSEPPRLVRSRQGPASGAPGNFLAGVVCLSLLGGAGAVGSLDGKHSLALAFPIATPTLLRRGSDVFISIVGFRAGVLAGVLPSLFGPGASVGQNIKFGHILDLVHRQLFTHLVVVYVLMERTDDSGGMNVWDGV